LELEKERLYKSLDGLPLSERLETYGLISDVRLRIEKMACLSEMIDGYIGIARKLSKEFDIVLVRELFSSLTIDKYSLNLAISLGGNEIKTAPTKEDKIRHFDKSIIHLFSKKYLSFNLYII
jgi:hypothetical protein